MNFALRFAVLAVAVLALILTHVDPARVEDVAITPVAAAELPAISLPIAKSLPTPTPSKLSSAKIEPAPLLTIPTIGLSSPIVPVGLTSTGEMDVPDGKTNDIGWYAAGTKPGDAGSAVLDAHVYAAFKRLHEVRPGDSVYVTDDNGKTLHFIVESTELAPIKDISLTTLFSRSDKARLNLITCAGTFLPELGTYDKRFIVYAVLAP